MNKPKEFDEIIHCERIGELIRCKDCKYYDDIEDADKPGYRECHYFGCWSTAVYMLPNDYCSCAVR